MADRIRPMQARVLLETDGSDDLAEYIVRIENRDQVRWDLIRARKQWPLQQDAPILWMSVCAWNALRRSGIEVGSVEDFIDHAVEIAAVDENGKPITRKDVEAREEADALDPSPSAADTEL